MIKIEPTLPINYSFTARKNLSVKDNQKDNTQKLLSAVAGLAVLGAAAVIVGKKTTSTYEEALKKNGVQIKDGVAVLISSGEKYTGSVKHNVQAYGTKKETVSFVDGVMTEKIYHNARGKELEGEFFKSGVLRVKVTKDANDSLKRYLRYEYDSSGKLQFRTDCHNLYEDKFDEARDIIKKL